MPSTNDPTLSMTSGGDGDGGFFGFIHDIGGIIENVRPIWDRTGNPPQPSDQPVSITPTNPNLGGGTTGTPIVATNQNLMPMFIMGGIILAVLLLK